MARVNVSASKRRRALALYSQPLDALANHDERVPALLEDEGPLPSASGYVAIVHAALESGGMAEVRREKHRRLLEIAARDLCGELPMNRVGVALADLADACLESALRVLDGPPGLAIIGMGKLGGRELNYASDIDVMFVTDGSVRDATKTVETLLQELGGFSTEGQAYRIDCNLRPEGRSGALVRPLDSYLEYYRRWAKPWEYQALIKARHAAGAHALGDRFVADTRPHVYVAEVTPERVTAIRKMKERVEDHSSNAVRSRRGLPTRAQVEDVKLGPGGIRDIEFSVQLLQLVHGGADAEVRPRATLDALAALTERGYVAEDDGAGLAVAYRWLRTVEHRCQLWQERQVHVLPQDAQGRARLARSMGFRDSAPAGALERFEQRHRAVLSDVRGRFDRLFYRPMIEALADDRQQGLSEDAIRERMRVLGFRDADRAARTLGRLVQGTSRRARLVRVLTPALLRFLASTPLPDAGLLGFLRLGDALDERIDALGMLRDNPPALALLARVLGSGALLGAMLEAVPDELATIADPSRSGRLKTRDQLMREAELSLAWRPADDRLDGLRRFKRRAMLHVAVADLGGQIDIQRVGAGLADAADACIEAALDECDFPFVVIGMGKLGGQELNYASDVDVVFVHDGSPDKATRVAEDLRAAIGEVTPEGQTFRIDLGLRPEGRSGPLVRSLASYLEYYARWAKPWEHQALIKARWVAGDPETAQSLIKATRGYAFPASLSLEFVAEIRHLKARMERERVARGTDPRRNLKMGPGGLADVEFATQMLQLRYGHRYSSMEVANTLRALEAAEECAVIEREERERLRASYVLLSRIRNHLFFATGRALDGLPARPEELEALGVALGFSEQPRQELEETYLRVTRRARRVFEHLFYD
ncbi:bifunctional [glutamine synthetase] adenylyltransferase/[glutamine synthetase]-adenylyl-L-tyrosine phosphorylase [soil metagenome]